MIAYHNGKFIAKEEVFISPDDRGFLFADGVYEVICSYNGKLFKLEEHLHRLKRSLNEIQMAVPPMKQLQDIAKELISRNGLSTVRATIYIQITRGAAPRSHLFPDTDTPSTVYATASPFRPFYQEGEIGVKVITLPDIRWGRCDIKSVCLLPNVLASQQAKTKGATEAVFIRDGVVTEGSHTNVAAVFENRLVTHPADSRILRGITREVVLDLSAELGIPVLSAPVLEKELKNADELMLLGTTYEILPVVQVNDRTVGDGTPGPVTRSLQRAFERLVTK
jgi:D-alanine transaminase